MFGVLFVWVGGCLTPWLGMSKTPHSGFNVMNFCNSALFFSLGFQIRTFFFVRATTKKQNCSETSMDRSLK